MLGYYTLMDKFINLRLGSVIPRPKKWVLELSF
jgi:hypothetical protein